MLRLLHRHLDAIAPGSRKFALPAGLLIGWIAWELSRVTPQTTYGLAMALVVVFSGSASFVLGALEMRTRSLRMTRQALTAEARVCVTWLGLGVAGGISALQAALA